MNATDFIEREKGIIGKGIEVMNDMIPTTKTKKLERMALGVIQHKYAGLLDTSEADRFAHYLADQADILGVHVTVDEVATSIAKLTKKEENINMLARAYGNNLTNRAYKRATRNIHFLGLGRGKNLPGHEPKTKKDDETPPEQIEGFEPA